MPDHGSTLYSLHTCVKFEVNMCFNCFMYGYGLFNFCI